MEAAKHRRFEVENLGEYKSTRFLHERENLFDDDDEILMMQIVMDENERGDMQKAVKSYVKQHANKKQMLCP